MGKSVWVSDGVETKSFSRSAVLLAATHGQDQDYVIILGRVVSDHVFPVGPTEILQLWDPRSNNRMFDESKLQEVQDFLSRGVFALVHQKCIPANANVLVARFGFSIKHAGTSS